MDTVTHIKLCNICYLNYNSNDKKPMVLPCVLSQCLECFNKFDRGQFKSPFDKKIILNIKNVSKTNYSLLRIVSNSENHVRKNNSTNLNLENIDLILTSMAQIIVKWIGYFKIVNDTIVIMILLN